MTRQSKAATGCNREAANIKKQRGHSIKSTRRVKPEVVNVCLTSVERLLNVRLTFVERSLSGNAIMGELVRLFVWLRLAWGG